MTIHEATAAGMIRWANGAENRAYSWRIETGVGYAEEGGVAEQVERICSTEARKYVGAAFVSLGAPLPSEVPLTTPEYCWAQPVRHSDYYGANWDDCRSEVIGHMVTWTTADHEESHRAARQSVVVSLEEFHAMRSAGIEDCRS